MISTLTSLRDVTGYGKLQRKCNTISTLTSLRDVTKQRRSLYQM